MLFSLKGEKHESERKNPSLSKTFPVVEIKESFQKRISRNTVRSSREAAGVLAFLSESAQEEVYLLTADQPGSIITLHKYGKGSNNEVPAIINQMSGHLFEMPNVHTVYLVHNHPSGDLVPSPADHWTFKTLKNTLRLLKIETKAVLIAGRQYVEFDEETVSSPAMIPANKEEFWQPISERKVVERRPLNPKMLFPGQSIMNRFKRSPDGILFTDIKAREVGFLPFSRGRTRDVAAKILATADRLNAANAFINMQTITNTNRGNLYTALAMGLEGQGIVVRDVVTKTAEGECVSFATDKRYQLLPPDSEAICQLDSDVALYATSSDFKPNMIDMSPGRGIDIKDIQERFKGQSITSNREGSLSIRFDNGLGAKIQFINHVSPQELRMLISSGRMNPDGDFLGKTINNQILFHQDLSSTWIRDHEFCHLLKNLEMVTDKDFKALDKQIQTWSASGSLKFRLINPTDDRAHALAQLLDDRKDQRSTRLGAMTQKVSDFIDGLWHIGRCSARKLALEIETGNIFTRNVREELMVTSVVQKDIDQHLASCIEAETEMQGTFEQILEDVNQMQSAEHHLQFEEDLMDDCSMSP